MNTRKCQITAVLALLVGLVGGYSISRLQHAEKDCREDMLNASFVTLNDSRIFRGIVEILHSTGKLEDDKTLRECLKIGVNGSIMGDAIIQVADSKGMHVVAMPQEDRSRLKAAKDTLETYDKHAEQDTPGQRPGPSHSDVKR